MNHEIFKWLCEKRSLETNNQRLASKICGVPRHASWVTQRKSGITAIREVDSIVNYFGLRRCPGFSLQWLDLSLFEFLTKVDESSWDAALDNHVCPVEMAPLVLEAHLSRLTPPMRAVFGRHEELPPPDLVLPTGTSVYAWTQADSVDLRILLSAGVSGIAMIVYHARASASVELLFGSARSIKATPNGLYFNDARPLVIDGRVGQKTIFAFAGYVPEKLFEVHPELLERPRIMNLGKMRVLARSLANLPNMIKASIEVEVVNVANNS